MNTSVSTSVPDPSLQSSVLGELSSEQRERLTTILDRYLEDLDQGVPQAASKLLEENPDLAEVLAFYLDSLNDLHGIAAGFRDPPEVESKEPPPPDDGNTKRLGDFVLGQEIGRGGMGVVYEATQISLDRRVALKVLPFAAVLDSKQIARFKNEAQAAAQLHHPNIVPVFAVGAERGVHYYAMQLIDGQPLDRAIDELRNKAGVRSKAAPAPTASREVERDEPSVCSTAASSFLTSSAHDRRELTAAIVRLGIEAAEALHAAHEYGVVHRDIKPSNLLLDRAGKLWITDFGLARCQSDAALTKTGDVVGTTRYMSPEQARGQTALVDHRTDVYALGLTLYELLTLQPAVQGDDAPAMLCAIEQEPPRLRKLQPEISVDLETVVMKAMAKQRDERYTTAHEFAADLRRVLQGQPTLAKPPTVVERMAKWTRRHKRLATVAAGVGFCAVMGFALSTLLIAREKRNTERNYQRAEKHFREARDAVDRFGAQLAERLAAVPGAEEVRRELLQATLAYYQDFADQAADDPSLRADLALTYSKIGTLADEIGSIEQSLEFHEKSLALFQELVATEPEATDYKRRLALCHNNLARALRRAGRVDDARRAYGDAIELQEEITRAADLREVVCDLALSHTNLGLLLSETDEGERAGRSYRDAIRLHERLLSDTPNDPDVLRKLAAAYNNLSSLYLATDPAKAEECYQIALSHQDKAVSARPHELQFRNELALTYTNLGAVQSNNEQYAEATVSYERAITLQEELVATSPLHRSFRRDLAVSYNNRGLMQSRQRQPAEAQESFLQALQLQEALVAQYPDDLALQSSLGGVYNNLGIVLEDLERVEDAAVAFKNAVEHQRIAFTQAASVLRYRSFLSKHYFNYGRVLRQLGYRSQAAKSALARRDLWPQDPQRLYSVAEELALAGASLANASDEGYSADECAALAAESLRHAVTLGLVLPADWHNHAPFAQLKKHASFAKLVEADNGGSW